ncbi:hypothetical protein M8818_007355 [Zalaria obscura]|uniref:Uncharacterized protein n=1 Tax=Zalaria obscura TaxID=2024903 RepID=A0ACC3S737_9PEZI
MGNDAFSEDSCSLFTRKVSNSDGTLTSLMRTIYAVSGLTEVSRRVQVRKVDLWQQDRVALHMTFQMILSLIFTSPSQVVARHGAYGTWRLTYLILLLVSFLCLSTCIEAVVLLAQHIPLCFGSRDCDQPSKYCAWRLLTKALSRKARAQ